jgi:hypothetical protein
MKRVILQYQKTENDLGKLTNGMLLNIIAIAGIIGNYFKWLLLQLTGSPKSQKKKNWYRWKNSSRFPWYFKSRMGNCNGYIRERMAGLC